MRVVACNIFVADRTGFRGFLTVTGDSSVNTAIGNRTWTIANHDFELFLEHYLVRDRSVFQPFKEIEHFLRNILPKQLVRVAILTLVIVGSLLCVKVGGSQFGIGHVKGFRRVDTLFLTQGQFAGQVALSQIVKCVGSVNIVVAVKLNLVLLLLGQWTVNIEGNRSLSNVHAKVSFNRFQGQTHLAIVHEVVLVEENTAVTKRCVFPPLMTL